MKNVTIRISEELHELLRTKSFVERKSINTILLEAIKLLLKQERSE